MTELPTQTITGLVHQPDSNGVIPSYSRQEVSQLSKITAIALSEHNSTSSAILSQQKLSAVSGEIAGELKGLVTLSNSMKLQKGTGFFSKLLGKKDELVEKFTEDVRSLESTIEKVGKSVNTQLSDVDVAVDEMAKIYDEGLKLMALMGNKILELDSAENQVKEQTFTDPLEQSRHEEYLNELRLQKNKLLNQQKQQELTNTELKGMSATSRSIKQQLEEARDVALGNIRSSLRVASTASVLEKSAKLIAGINEAAHQIAKHTDKKFVETTNQTVINMQGGVTRENVDERYQYLKTELKKIGEKHDAILLKTQEENALLIEGSKKLTLSAEHDIATGNTGEATLSSAIGLGGY